MKVMTFNKLKPCMSGNGNLNLTLNRDDECLPSVQYLGWCEHGIYVGLTRFLSLWRSFRYHFCFSFCPCLRLSYFNVLSYHIFPSSNLFFSSALRSLDSGTYKENNQRLETFTKQKLCDWMSYFFGHSCCLLRLKILVSLILFRINS